MPAPIMMIDLIYAALRFAIHYNSSGVNIFIKIHKHPRAPPMPIGGGEVEARLCPGGEPEHEKAVTGCCPHFTPTFYMITEIVKKTVPQH
jgi:hypothetical protein